MERRQATQDQARLPTAASFFRREGQDGALGNQCVTQVIGARAVSPILNPLSTLSLSVVAEHWLWMP